MTQPVMLGTIGIGVSDLERSTDFYVRVLGMTELRRYVLDTMDEVILSAADGAKLALMQWTDGSTQHYGNNPVKLVFYVPDPFAVIELIRAEGFAIDREAEAVESLGGIVIAVGHDPDGYVVELLNRPVVAT
jgi:lactoylglutathione lyase